MGLRDLFRRKREQPTEFDATSRLEYPADTSRQTFQPSRETGTELAQPRGTDFFLYLRTREDADAVCDELRVEGFAVRSSADPEAERPWLVVASRQLVVEEESIDDVEAMLRELAERYGGEYDGWETSAG